MILYSPIPVCLSERTARKPEKNSREEVLEASRAMIFQKSRLYEVVNNQYNAQFDIPTKFLLKSSQKWV